MIESMKILKLLFALIFLQFSFLALGLEKVDSKKTLFFNKSGLDISYKMDIKIDDPISEKPINTVVYKLFNKTKGHIGYLRSVKTSTGCNSECLPVIFTLFYNADGSFKKLLSKDGLTKLGHEPFSSDDYFKLEMILNQNYSVLNKVLHPKEMTDALSGATIRKFVPYVVKEAAYSSLRIHLYNQHTLKFLRKLHSKK